MAITWLASYPKSGNTWFRLFLSNLLRDGDEPVHINAIEPTPIASARPFIEDTWGIDAGDLTHDEVDNIRPRVYEYLAQTTEEPHFSKIHDGYFNTPAGEPMFPASATRRALYFIRSPLDVAGSYAHHSATDVERIIRTLNRADHAMSAPDQFMTGQLRQRLGTWSQHVRSWTGVTAFPVHVIRYEDMVQNTTETFTRAVEFLELDADAALIDKAIRFSAMEELQKQEAEHGFREKMQRSKSFFRKGQVGSWREELSDEQRDRLIDAHREVMAEFGYLDGDVPVF